MSDFYGFMEQVWTFLFGFFNQAYSFLVEEHKVLGMTFTGFEIISVIGVTAILVGAVIKIFL